MTSKYVDKIYIRIVKAKHNKMTCHSFICMLRKRLNAIVEGDVLKPVRKSPREETQLLYLEIP